MTVSTLLKVIAGVISVYTMLCFIRIILTWIPGASYSGFGRFLASVCDPYLTIFRNIRWLRFGAFDFTPAVAMCVLIALSTVLGNFAASRYFTVGSVLALLLSLAWSIFTSFLGFMIILIGVRLAVMLMHRDSGSYGNIWEQIDRALSPFLFKVTTIFTGGRPVPYKNALIAGLITLIVIEIGGKFIINILANMLAQLPF